MRLFLKLKHWQVFLIWIFGTIQMVFFMKTDLWVFTFAIYFGVLAMWIYSIGNVLKTNTRKQKEINVWWVLYTLSIVPIANNFHNVLTNSYNLIQPWIFVLSGTIGFIAIVKILIYTIRTLKRAETNKEHKLIDLVPELVLIFTTILGVWALQPRLNKLLAERDKN